MCGEKLRARRTLSFDERGDDRHEVCPPVRRRHAERAREGRRVQFDAPGPRGRRRVVRRRDRADDPANARVEGGTEPDGFGRKVEPRREWRTGKLEQARRMGAAGGVNYRDEHWAKRLAELSGGMDVVIDGTGGPSFKDCFSLLKPAGRLVIYGATAGNPPRGLEMAKLFFRQARIIGSTMGSPAEFADMLHLVAEHRIEPALDRVFPFDQAVAAHQRLLAGEQMGKIVLRHG